MGKKKVKPSEHDFSGLTVNETLDLITKLRLAKERMEADDAALLIQLDRLVADGKVDQGGFSHNGFPFSWSSGKTAWEYPQAVQDLEVNLKAAKEAAQSNGTATKVTTGDPYWTVRLPQS